MCYKLLILALLIGLSTSDIVIGQDELVDEISGYYTIEGKVYAPDLGPAGASQGLAVQLPQGNKWQNDLSVSINNGEYKGFVREDGQFIISGVPSGSYVLDVYHPDIFYEPVRVEINPKGKFRARKVNYIQPAQVVQVPYPLRMKPLMRFKYFQTREQWKITDFLFSPMVLMMALPLLLMLVLPKMINDPETKKEIENMQFSKMTNDMPEISEMITSLLSGKQPEPKEKKPVAASKQTKKRN
ncbi:ER membrane protein complex subunit 7 homolog [Drosophila sulfurigaster albostrigata]|uniref:ER membrane protein complex subunit 7 homolog n=1 Tax=Drosophila sulfurigaster albostrigata TaxID=89887 RepID=UPI002D21A5B6|nr:ER membrane protein complex subunit 7 homolog [Drosophila sulfurigaster albostrigata]